MVKNCSKTRKGIPLNLSQTNNFKLFQTQSLQTTILNLMKVAGYFFKKVENTVGKEEIARYEQFLLFLTMFLKNLYCRRVKTMACLGKG